jgi:hypothetical protein
LSGIDDNGSLKRTDRMRLLIASKFSSCRSRANSTMNVLLFDALSIVIAKSYHDVKQHDDLFNRVHTD